ncbi:vitellogenin-1-like [Bradysia coprophila]|uniref:vitellogenin-1-like n=1 Tax=Bradysia coprophila TaxID=38358 RepID=UPI00187DAAA4|nr:vitellogenin-1-like [Bradysia coprophila]
MKTIFKVTITILCFTSLLEAVAGYGAWEENRVYNYKLQAYTRNSDGGVLAHGRLTIYPLSEVLLIGRISLLEYSKVDRHLTEDNNLDLSRIDFDDQLPITKPFLIHLENGTIHSISVDSMMSRNQINQLKVIVSQFQLDTNAQYLFKSEDEHLPEEGNTTVFYKTMEQTFTGNCETLYNISTLSNNLVKSHPKWVPLPNLNERGDFIKVEKTRNFNSSNRYFAFYNNGQSDFQSRPDSDSHSDQMSAEGAEQRPNQMDEASSSITTHVVISRDLQTYTIQSSITTGHGDGFYDYMEITLESVEEQIQRMTRFEGMERLVNVGNLVYGTDTESGERLVTDLQNRQSKSSCLKAENARVEWSGCWTDFVSGPSICKKEFGPEWEYLDYDCCGFLCLGRKAKCRLSYPGCVATVCYSVFVPQDKLCNSQYGDRYPVTCDGFPDCSLGFWRARCCPSSYA